MLNVPRTIPSRWTMRLGSGSSTAGAAGSDVAEAVAFVTPDVSGWSGVVSGAVVGVAAVSVTVGATTGASATVAAVVGVGAGVGSGVTAVEATAPGASCLRY